MSITAFKITEMHQPKSTKDSVDATKVPNGFWIGKRHWLTLLGFIGIFNIYTVRTCLSMAIVAMVAPNGLAQDNATDLLNWTLPIQASPDACPEPAEFNRTSGLHKGFRGPNSPSFQWTSEIQGIILGSYFYGYIVTQVAGGWISRRLGGKYPFGIGILISGILTLLTPVVTGYHYGALIALRVGEGLATGVCYPAMQQLLAEWSPAAERSRMSALVNAGAPVGNIVVLALSGVLGHHLGWESIFYVFGGITCLWFIFWQMCIHNSPDDHPRITHAEIILITGCKKMTKLPDDESIKKTCPPVPWSSILTSGAVWAMFIAHFGQNWGNYTLLTSLPTYMKNILRFELSANGLFSALPYLALWIIGVGSGYVADILRHRRWLSTTNVRKLFNTFGNLIPAAALIGVGYAGCDCVTAIVLLVVATGFTGLTSASYQVNSLDLSPAFAAIIFGLSNTLANIPGFVSPYTVGFITAGPNGQTLDNWRLIFYISGGVRVFTALIYAMFASGELADWNYTGDREPVGFQ